MSYELKKTVTLTEKEKMDFIVEYNHNKGLKIEDTEMFLFALEPNEIMGEKEIEIDIPNEEGMEVNSEYEISDGESVPVEPKYIHTTITIPYPVMDPNYEEKESKKEKDRIGDLKITKRVFALYLKEFGISYSQLKELISTNEQAQMEWDLCVELQRQNPLLDLMGAELNVTPKQIDYIFRKANGEDISEEL